MKAVAAVAGVEEVDGEGAAGHADDEIDGSVAAVVAFLLAAAPIFSWSDKHSAAEMRSRGSCRER